MYLRKKSTHMYTYAVIIAVAFISLFGMSTLAFAEDNESGEVERSEHGGRFENERTEARFQNTNINNDDALRTYYNGGRVGQEFEQRGYVNGIGNRENNYEIPDSQKYNTNTFGIVSGTQAIDTASVTDTADTQALRSQLVSMQQLLQKLLQQLFASLTGTVNGATQTTPVATPANTSAFPTL